MNDNLNLYMQSNYQPFVFSDWQRICGNYEIDGVIEDNTAILRDSNSKVIKLLNNRDELIVIEKSCFLLIHDPIAIKHGIVFAQLNQNASYRKGPSSTHFNAFRLDVLQALFIWYEKYLIWINDYLSKRISEGIAITSHGVMRIALSECIEALTILNSMFSSNNNGNNFIGLANILMTSTKTLANCSGGRGFTGSNILEMHWLSILLNKALS